MCKIYWLVDIEHGINDPDIEFLKEIRDKKVTLELVFTKADRVDQLKVMDRALGLTHEIKKFSDFVSPICHVTSAK